MIESGKWDRSISKTAMNMQIDQFKYWNTELNVKPNNVLRSVFNLERDQRTATDKDIVKEYAKYLKIGDMLRANRANIQPPRGRRLLH
ncbi:hypothetical protein ON010_g8134 [Phytophthora cinnamomi]|nr:hypothetical protein ON010_g8134 [Phytophthora cinnamomi]